MTATTASAAMRGREAAIRGCYAYSRNDFMAAIDIYVNETTRHAEVKDLGPDAPLPPSAFDFVFPTGTTMLY